VSVLHAQAELALQLALNPQAMTGAVGSPVDSRVVTRERVDVLEQEFAELPESLRWREARMPQLFKQFPWLRDILGCWLDTASGRMLRVVRN
jgi:hypothetical protein